MTIDLKGYQEKKAKNLAFVISSDPQGNGTKTFVVRYVKYDPIKASEGVLVRVSDEIAYVTKKELTDRIAELQEEISLIEEFIAEGEA